MAYCDTTYADTYLSAGAFASKWTGSDKAKYLEQATRFIKEYSFFLDEDGDPFTYDDEDNTVTIPDFLKRATCEEALYLITLGKDPTAGDKKTTLGISSAKGAVFDKRFSADILCKACIALIERNDGIVSGEATSGNSVSVGWIVK